MAPRLAQKGKHFETKKWQNWLGVRFFRLSGKKLTLCCEILADYQNSLKKGSPGTPLIPTLASKKMPFGNRPPLTHFVRVNHNSALAFPLKGPPRRLAFVIKSWEDEVDSKVWK